MKSSLKKSDGKKEEGKPKEINELEKSVEVYKNKYVRALADYQNMLRRVQEEKEAYISQANKEFIKKLLPIVDDLEKAVRLKKDEGLELVLRNFNNILYTEGVTRIDIQESMVFDPTIMECIEAENDGKRLIELRKGYQYNGQLLRPLQVKVVV